MKRLFIMLGALLVACADLSAQKAEIREAAKRYENVNTLITAVTQTRHSTIIAEDAVAEGHFYYLKPDCMSMVFKDSGEQFYAVGNTYVMVKDGKSHTAKGKGRGDNPFETLKLVFTDLLSGKDDPELSRIAEVDLEKQGDICTVTIVPVAENAKARRRMMYTSCVATIDLKAAELRRVHISEKDGNYTQYDFSNYLPGAEISYDVFSPKTGL